MDNGLQHIGKSMTHKTNMHQSILLIKLCTTVTK